MSVAFTWAGLRALGLDEASLATFPDEFRQGMVARAQMLGDTGANHPDNWVGDLASHHLHAIVILFARDASERERSTREHQAHLARTPAVEVLSSLELQAISPDHARDHFGYRDRLTDVAVEGAGDDCQTANCHVPHPPPLAIAGIERHRHSPHLLFLLRK